MTTMSLYMPPMLAETISGSGQETGQSIDGAVSVPTPMADVMNTIVSSSVLSSIDWTSLSGMISKGMTIAAVLILVCACASKLSSWINMPCLLVFLGIGMLAGSEGIGNITFDSPTEANVIGSLAMAFILFSGGFDTSWKKVRSVILPGTLLSTVGVLLTAIGVGIGSYYFLNWLYPALNVRFSWCLLLGSIISSTDAAAVFSILRSRSVSLKGDLQPLLELESGSNDPMAAFLTIFMVGVVLTESASGTVTTFSEYKMVAPMFIQKMLLGIVLGMAWGKAIAWLFNKIDFEYDGLYYVLGTAAVLLSYGGTEMLQGNGFMSVYVTGLVMGNSKFIYHNGVGRFSEGVAWLMQVVLFTMLGLLVKPSLLWEYRWIGLGIAAILMFAARPAAVFLCMIKSKFSFREQLLVSWVGLRGGAPIMLATFPLMAKTTDNNLMFHIVFFAVLTSVLLQGMLIMKAAKALNLDKPLKISPRIPLEFDNTGTLSGDTREFEILPGSSCAGRTLAALGLPRGALVLLIRRGGGFLVPHGDTMIIEGDGLLVLGGEKDLAETEKFLLEMDTPPQEKEV